MIDLDPIWANRDILYGNLNMVYDWEEEVQKTWYFRKLEIIS